MIFVARKTRRDKEFPCVRECVFGIAYGNAVGKRARYFEHVLPAVVIVFGVFESYSAHIVIEFLVVGRIGRIGIVGGIGRIRIVGGIGSFRGFYETAQRALIARKYMVFGRDAAAVAHARMRIFVVARPRAVGMDVRRLVVVCACVKRERAKQDRYYRDQIGQTFFHALRLPLRFIYYITKIR